MNFTEALQSVFNNFTNFSGRARRSEYWYFFLFNYVSMMILSKINILSGVYSLIVFIPALAVLIRRLHDTGRPGWWFFIVFLPIVGAFVLIYLLAQDSQPGTNQYGPNPKDGPSFDEPYFNESKSFENKY